MRRRRSAASFFSSRSPSSASRFFTLLCHISTCATDSVIPFSFSWPPSPSPSPFRNPLIGVALANACEIFFFLQKRLHSSATVRRVRKRRRCRNGNKQLSGTEFGRACSIQVARVGQEGADGSEWSAPIAQIFALDNEWRDRREAALKDKRSDGDSGGGIGPCDKCRKPVARRSGVGNAHINVVATCYSTVKFQLSRSRRKQRAYAAAERYHGFITLLGKPLKRYPYSVQCSTTPRAETFNEQASRRTKKKKINKKKKGDVVPTANDTDVPAIFRICNQDVRSVVNVGNSKNSLQDLPTLFGFRRAPR